MFLNVGGLQKTALCISWGFPSGYFPFKSHPGVLENCVKNTKEIFLTLHTKVPKVHEEREKGCEEEFRFFSTIPM